MQPKVIHLYFVKFMPSYTIYVLIYIDDIIITGSSKHEVTTLISQLSECFALKDLDPIHYFLGIEVTHSQNGDLLLSQSKYITDLLRRTNMLFANPLPTPMQSTLRLQQDASPAMTDPTLYHSVVGTLQYILITRPELAFVVNKVRQFMHDPQDHHWKAVKRILRYLAGTSSHGLLIKHNSSSTILVFIDADWGSDMDDRKSTTGYCVYLGSNLVAWSSHKQRLVSRSSTEAEYRSIVVVLTEVLWLQSLLHELHITLY